MRGAAALLVFLAILSITVLAQPRRPTDAFQIGDPSEGYDIRFPTTVSQCEPVLIYFNVIGVGEGFVGFDAPDNGPYNFLIRMQLPRYDIGYMEWICNIPAGYRFLVYNIGKLYVNVQAGPSSCLGNITTSSLPGGGHYFTGWNSYTANPPNTTTPSLLTGRPLATSIVSFPIADYPTVLLNPELVVATTSTTTTSTPSPTQSIAPSRTSSPVTTSFEPASFSSSPAPPRKSNVSAIAGGVIGGIVVAVAFSIALLCLRKRRRTDYMARPIPMEEPIDNPDADWMTSQYGSNTVQLLPATADLTDRDSTPSWLQSNSDSLTSRNLLLTHEQAGGSPRSAKSGLITLSYTEPTTSIRESVNSQSNLVASLDAISRLNPSTRQREAIMTSLTSNVDFSSDPTLTPIPMAEMQETASSRMSGDTRNEASELTAVLSSISRLSENERSALVSMLNSMTRPVPSADLTGEYSVFPAPPPYRG